MKPEIEAKFLHVDHEKLRAKLRGLGATCEKPMQPAWALSAMPKC